jgi:hydroxymethylglutaryl-CoA lyase
MADLPKAVHIMEVGPRDGLQIEARTLSADDKAHLIDALVGAGISEIEVGSFVSPKAVPQMADTEEVIKRLPPRPGVRYRALWLNAKGLERALATGKVHMEGKLTLTASETFVKRNTNRTIEQTIAEMPQWIGHYKAAGIKVDGLGLMAAFGCNFEGDIPGDRVVGLVERTASLMREHGCELEHLLLADTMGWANPAQIQRRIGDIRQRWPRMTLKLHLHDTRGLAMANAFAAISLGVTEFDAAIGGLGGCPFAGHKGAAGNICTEDLAFMCEEMGIETGIDLDALVAAAQLAEELVGHPLPSKLAKGGTLSRFRSR